MRAMKGHSSKINFVEICTIIAEFDVLKVPIQQLRILSNMDTYYDSASDIFSCVVVWAYWTYMNHLGIYKNWKPIFVRQMCYIFISVTYVDAIVWRLRCWRSAIYRESSPQLLVEVSYKAICQLFRAKDASFWIQSINIVVQLKPFAAHDPRHWLMVDTRI